MDWEDALELCEEIEELLDELPDRAEEFATSVGEKVADMREWIEDNEHVTPKQLDALENMKAGCENWLQ